MSGVNAAVLLEGMTRWKTQGLEGSGGAFEINAGTASLIATAINPTGPGHFSGAGFSAPLMQAATQEFHIDGTWADPKVSK
jgi:uncharacterized protein YhdP